MTIHHLDSRSKSVIGKIIVKIPTYIIAISQFTKNQIIEHNINQEKIFVNYNGINNCFYPESDKQLSISYKYILYVGTEVSRKNFGNLLKAFKNITKIDPNLKLIKIGKPGTIKDEKNTDMLVDKLNIKDNIIFKRNFISEEKLRKHYSNALCYVSVSKLEGFGLTIPEAMACGCPVVASDIGPFKEIVGDFQIIVNPDNIKEIELGILKYIEDSKFRKIMSAKAIELSQKFDWNKNVKFLVNLLKEKS